MTTMIARSCALAAVGMLLLLNIAKVSGEVVIQDGEKQALF